MLLKHHRKAEDVVKFNYVHLDLIIIYEIGCKSGISTVVQIYNHLY